MKIDVRKEADVTVVQPDGRMDFNGLMEFNALLNRTILEGTHKILLNFTTLEYLSSSGIRSLVDIHKKLEAVKGRLAFCSLNAQLKELFQVVQLDKVMKIYPTEFEAFDYLFD